MEHMYEEEEEKTGNEKVNTPSQPSHRRYKRMVWTKIFYMNLQLVMGGVTK